MFWFKPKPKVNMENLGVNPDSRLPEEKELDYKSEEIVAAYAPIAWVEKPESQWRKYPRFFQDGSSSCLFQAIAKALGIENYLEEGKFIPLSRRDGYCRRINYPSPGTIPNDGMHIGYKYGLTVEQSMPSQGLSEARMNDFSDRTPFDEFTAKLVKGGNHFLLPIDIEAIASIIEPTGKPVVLCARFGPNEWFGKKVPQILGTDTPYAHGFCATNTTLYQGKKATIIEDSAYYNADNEAVRVLTEDWFKTGRVYFASYYDFLKNDGLPQKPKWKFERNLKWGDDNEDVKHLKECLCYKRCFPSEGVNFTGYFGGITLKGVQLYQTLMKIPVNGIADEITRQALNREFA